MSFDDQPTAQRTDSSIEAELTELRINSMIKALGVQRDQALNQTAKLMGDLSVERARVNILEASLLTAAGQASGYISANAVLVSRVLQLEVIIEEKQAHINRVKEQAVLEETIKVADVPINPESQGDEESKQSQFSKFRASTYGKIDAISKSLTQSI